jgi:hypothetical protein
MRSSIALGITGLVFAALTRAGSSNHIFISYLTSERPTDMLLRTDSITPDGVPAGFEQPATPPGNRTDFDSIFSDISQLTTLTARTPRDIQLAARQARATPKFFELTFGPTGAANNADGVSGPRVA